MPFVSNIMTDPEEVEPNSGEAPWTSRLRYRIPNKQHISGRMAIWNGAFLTGIFEKNGSLGSKEFRPPLVIFDQKPSKNSSINE